MSKLKKIKWLMFILSHDGIPPRTLSDDMDPIEVYCILVLLSRVYVSVTKKLIPLEFHLSMESAKYQYATTKRGVEKKRLQRLKDEYNKYLFEWEKNDERISNMY